jgi:tetratricopeptide (TPR) repeat protein
LLYTDSLGLAYYRKGDLENAQKVYESVSSLTTGRSSYGDIYAKSFYMLGKIYEEMGWKGKAIENYEKFLELWKDADPGLSEVDDAKSRLSSLTQE